jgi:hypothetical protein
MLRKETKRVARTAFYIFLAVAGPMLSVCLARGTYLTLKDGYIERRKGLSPLSPHSNAVLYWFFIACTAFGALIAMWGTVTVILTLLNNAPI